MSKKNKKKNQLTPDLIDLSPYLDNDVMQTDVLGSYTGIPYNPDDENAEYETPTQDADDL